jgi:hypothetical protein
MKTATVKKFRDHRSPPAEFKKRLLEERARDFEKIEAAVYQNTTPPEGIAEIEAQRLRYAVEIAATALNISVDDALAKFLSDSGDPKLLEAIQEI